MHVAAGGSPEYSLCELTLVPKASVRPPLPAPVGVPALAISDGTVAVTDLGTGRMLVHVPDFAPRCAPGRPLDAAAVAPGQGSSAAALAWRDGFHVVIAPWEDSTCRPVSSYTIPEASTVSCAS